MVNSCIVTWLGARHQLLAAAFWFALAQQCYAFALGILYATWLEKSGSVLAPVIGHFCGDL